MKRIICVLSVTCVLVFAMVSASMAGHVEDYERIAKETVQAIISGSVSNVDKLIANQEHLMEIALEECQEHQEETPKDAKLMDLVINNASRMKTSSLEKPEEDWHDGGVLTANGIDFDAMDPLAPATIFMHMVVHPASAYIALKDYKSSKDEEMLDVVKDELSEVISHMKHVREHLKSHDH